MDIDKMDTPRLEADYDSIKVAGEYARQVIGREGFHDIIDDYHFDRHISYKDASDRVMIELAASVISGEHPEINEDVDYDPHTRINGGEFVKIANRLSGSSRTGEEELSELGGTTQVGDKEISSERIRAIRNIGINEQFYEKENGESGRDTYCFRFSFYNNHNMDGSTTVDHIADQGITRDMVDRLQALEDERNFKEWP